MFGKKKCRWCNECRNGGDGCWTSEPENCIRFLPLKGGNLTEFSGTIETPPEINCDKFSQYFMNWVDSMGWSFTGSFAPYKEEE